MQTPAFNSDDDFALHGREYQLPPGVARYIRDLMVAEVPPPYGQRLSTVEAIRYAVRDLEQYHGLMAEALLAQRFDEDQAVLLVAVCQDWLICCPSEARRLWTKVRDYFAMAQCDCDDEAACAKWQLDLLERLRLLSPLEALAVVRAAQRVWSLSPSLPVSTALVAVDLVNPDAHQSAFGVDATTGSDGAW